MLLPLENLALRRALNHWFDKHRIRPRVIAEFEDSALLKVFGSEGVGIFPAPTVVAEEIKSQYNVKLLGHATPVEERFYAISIERRIANPAAVAIWNAARHELFASKPIR